LRFIGVGKKIKRRREAMTKNKMMELVNKDEKLLLLFGGLLLDGILLIALIIYVGIKLIS
jgi:hypothetical protein